MTELYTIRSTPAEGEFVILKLDEDYNPAGMYALNLSICTCPAGHRPTCKHRKMLPLFLKFLHIDDGWFLDWNTRLWRKPFGEPAHAADKALADTTIMDNSRPSEPPILGQSEEDRMASVIAPAFESQSSSLAQRSDAPEALAGEGEKRPLPTPSREIKRRKL